MDDANGGIGDELDSISLRDVAAVRYVRHHEWLELVLGTAIPTHKIEAPSIIVPSGTEGGIIGGDWSFNNADSVKAKLDSLQKEIDELEQQASEGWADKSRDSKTEFYRRATAKLREDFGSVSSDKDYTEKLIKDVESRFDVSLVEKKSLRRVGADIELPSSSSSEGEVEPESERATKGNYREEESGSTSEKSIEDESAKDIDMGEADQHIEDQSHLRGPLEDAAEKSDSKSIEDPNAEADTESSASASEAKVTEPILPQPAVSKPTGSEPAIDEPEIPQPTTVAASRSSISEVPVSELPVSDHTKSEPNSVAEEPAPNGSENIDSLSSEPSADSALPNSRLETVGTALEGETLSNDEAQHLSDAFQEPDLSLEPGQDDMLVDEFAEDSAAALTAGQDIYMDGTNFDDQGLNDVLGSFTDA